MKVLAVLWVLVFALAAAGQERFVRPVDEAAKDRSFLAFRTRLIAAAERKDAKFIDSIIDPDIKISFGIENGAANFRKFWNPEAKDSKFWEEFTAVIKNGGAFFGEGRNKYNAFAAPFPHTSWPDDLDAFEHQLIFGTNVNLREGPSVEAKVLDRLSYNVVKAVQDPEAPMSEERPEWIKIETLGGKSGYVNSRYVRSPIDYRAGFEKKRGQWKMTFFVAGD